MQKKQFLLGTLILSFILLSGLAVFFYPQIENYFSPKTEVLPISEYTFPKDTLGFKRHLQNSLGVLKTNKISRKRRESNSSIRRETWVVGKGRTIVEYLLLTKKYVEANGGKILSMEEIFNKPYDSNPFFQAANIQLLDSQNDSLNIQLKISNSDYIPGHSKIAIVFEGKELSSSLDFLKTLNYPHTILITPQKENEKERLELERSPNSNRTIVLWQFMQSRDINSGHKNAIQLQDLEEGKIEQILLESFGALPDAVGLATRLGEQAVENESFLTSILQVVQNRDAFFLDLTGVKTSKTNFVCRDLNLLCASLKEFNPGNQSVEEYIKKVLKDVAKKGNAVMILPLDGVHTEKIWKELAGIEERVEKQGTEITTLQSLMELNQ